MSDSSRVRVSIVAESVYGSTPSSPAMLILPITGASLQDRVGYVQSNVIVDSRNVEDLVRVSKSAGGGIPCELRYSPADGGLDRAIRAVLCSGAFTAAATVNSVEVVGLGTTITRGSGSFVSDGFEVGDLVRLSDNNNGDDGFYMVTAVEALTLTVQAAGSQGAGWTDDDSSCVVVRGARAKNGTTNVSFSVEVAYLDLQIAHIFTGCVFSGAEIGVAIGQLSTIAFSLDGQTSTRVDSNTGTTDQFIAGATYTAAASHPTLDPIGVQEIKVAGSDYAASSVNMSLTNNVRGREQLGALGPQSMAKGQFGATGRISAYFEDFDDHDDFAENVASSVWWAMLDANSRGYSFSYPQVKFSDVSNPVQGNNADVFKSIAATAYKDPTELCTLRMQRWGD